MYLQFKKIMYDWRESNYDLPLLSCHLELDSDISLSHGPLTVGIVLDSYGLCSQWCTQRRSLSLGARAMGQGCPLGAAGALASGPQLSYGPAVVQPPCRQHTRQFQPQHSPREVPVQRLGLPWCPPAALLLTGAEEWPTCQALSQGTS